jgi:hypothetical protein
MAIQSDTEPPVTSDDNAAHYINSPIILPATLKPVNARLRKGKGKKGKSPFASPQHSRFVLIYLVDLAVRNPEKLHQKQRERKREDGARTAHMRLTEVKSLILARLQSRLLQLLSILTTSSTRLVTVNSRLTMTMT